MQYLYALEATWSVSCKSTRENTHILNALAQYNVVETSRLTTGRKKAAKTSKSIQLKMARAFCILQSVFALENLSINRSEVEFCVKIYCDYHVIHGTWERDTKRCLCLCVRKSKDPQLNSFEEHLIYWVCDSRDAVLCSFLCIPWSM